jgi:hypothetical protein
MIESNPGKVTGARSMYRDGFTLRKIATTYGWSLLETNQIIGAKARNARAREHEKAHGKRKRKLRLSTIQKAKKDALAACTTLLERQAVIANFGDITLPGEKK